MEPDEFEALETIAHDRGASVSELMREAAHAQLFAEDALPRRVQAAEDFLRLPDAPLPAWEDLEAELLNRRD